MLHRFTSTEKDLYWVAQLDWIGQLAQSVSRWACYQGL